MKETKIEHTKQWSGSQHREGSSRQTSQDKSIVGGTRSKARFQLTNHLTNDLTCTALFLLLGAVNNIEFIYIYCRNKEQINNKKE